MYLYPRDTNLTQFHARQPNMYAESLVSFFQFHYTQHFDRMRRSCVNMVLNLIDTDFDKILSLQGINIGQFYLLQYLRKIITHEISGLIARDAYGKSMNRLQADTATEIFKVVDFNIESWKVKKRRKIHREDASVDIFEHPPVLISRQRNFQTVSSRSLYLYRSSNQQKHACF